MVTGKNTDSHVPAVAGVSSLGAGQLPKCCTFCRQIEERRDLKDFSFGEIHLIISHPLITLGKAFI